MKKFSIHSFRNLLAVIFVLGLGYVAYTVSPGTVTPTKVDAVATSANVSGWAFSLGAKVGTEASDPSQGPYTAGSNPGLGWISLSSLNEASGVAYGVNITPMTGIGSFSGQAWAGNDLDSNGNPTGIGWISFDRGVTGSPNPVWGDPGLLQTGTPLAYIDWSTGNVYGWARTIVACKNNFWNGTACTSSSAGDTAGGWDGWIKLSDASWVDGVKLDLVSRKFSGKAWGGDVLGWIDFAPVNTTTGLPINTMAQVAQPVCSAGDSSSYTYTGQPCVASCVSGGSSSQTVTGTQYASCLDGNPTPPTSQSCTTTLSCSNINGVLWIPNDTICNGDAGENSTNSLADCKPKTKFWQF